MTTKIQFAGSRHKVRLVADRLRAILAGREADSYGIAEGFMLSLGFGALSDVKAAFQTKTAGGTDEMGVKWPPLKPETIARRKMFSGPTTNDSQEVKDYIRLYGNAYRRNLKRLKLSLPEAQAKTRAKQLAAAEVRKKLGKTKVEILGSRTVEILRDTGILFNSLSPGTITTNNIGGGHYDKPSAPGGDEQVFERAMGTVIVGTNVPYAAPHQFGVPSRNLPQRQILPERGDQIPDVWWERWFGISMLALEYGTAELYRRSA